jgi:hypothetical protein
MNTTKKIKKILQTYKINPNILKEYLEMTYPDTSRMPEYILKGVYSPSKAIMDKLWENYGVPHQIFIEIAQYMEEKA